MGIAATKCFQKRANLGHGFLADLGRAWESAAAAAPMQVVHARFGVVLSRAGGCPVKNAFALQTGAGRTIGQRPAVYELD